MTLFYLLYSTELKTEHVFENFGGGIARFLAPQLRDQLTRLVSIT